MARVASSPSISGIWMAIRSEISSPLSFRVMDPLIGHRATPRSPPDLSSCRQPSNSAAHFCLGHQHRRFATGVPPRTLSCSGQRRRPEGTP
jgi:hypothetical protein